MNFSVKKYLSLQHKLKYSCESIIYFNLNPEIIYKTCNIGYQFVKSNINPAVFDYSNKIILANSQIKTYSMYKNNVIFPRNPSFLYIMVNRNTSCNCECEAENISISYLWSMS